MADGLGTHVTRLRRGVRGAVASNRGGCGEDEGDELKAAAAGDMPAYTGALDCAVKTVRAEGPRALYKGFIPTISRQGPFTVVLFVTLEQEEEEEREERGMREEEEEEREAMRGPREEPKEQEDGDDDGGDNEEEAIKEEEDQENDEEEEDEDDDEEEALPPPKKRKK
ncbi:uncharacterized protein A4U43_C03F3760 [Asparagus officinalis]|uniref:Uncharacterized protein n=1 Tax=Asparagus officinalis TaxID=4686 RepID=A0A5P1F8W8_ASPOF|nr:uncharacterized protein A4U43_C03F3760 [Asparagus officinalis]